MQHHEHCAESDENEEDHHAGDDSLPSTSIPHTSD